MRNNIATRSDDLRLRRGPESPKWRGGIKRRGKYLSIYAPDNPRATNSYVYLRIFIAEKALGHTLPDGAQVHHFDEDRDNNVNSNLVICEDAAYHALLHYRSRIVKAGGDPDKHKICWQCKRLLTIEQFYRSKNTFDGRSQQCRDCRKQYVRSTR